MVMALRRTCRCSHARDAHEHYRRGSDCASCACARYRGGFVLTVSVRTGSPSPRVIVPERVEQVAGPYVRPTHSAGTGGRPVVARQVAAPRHGLSVAEQVSVPQG